MSELDKFVLLSGDRRTLFIELYNTCVTLFDKTDNSLMPTASDLEDIYANLSILDDEILYLLDDEKIDHDMEESMTYTFKIKGSLGPTCVAFNAYKLVT